MAEAQFDFAAIDAIDAESIGEPGKRTFRIRILRDGESASLWVEKQQLAALGEAIPWCLCTTSRKARPKRYQNSRSLPSFTSSAKCEA